MFGGRFSYFPCRARDLFIDTMVIKREKEKMAVGKCQAALAYEFSVTEPRICWAALTQIYFPHY